LKRWPIKPPSPRASPYAPAQARVFWEYFFNKKFLDNSVWRIDNVTSETSTFGTILLVVLWRLVFALFLVLRLHASTYFILAHHIPEISPV